MSLMILVDVCTVQLLLASLLCFVQSLCDYDVNLMGYFLFQDERENTLTRNEEKR